MINCTKRNLILKPAQINTYKSYLPGKDIVVNVEFINPFINGAMNVMEKMAFLKPKVGKPYLKKGNLGTGDVSGILGLTGIDTRMRGSLAISFKKGAILKIVSNMLGEKYEEINADVFDAAGEITNMISGQARKELTDKKGYSIEASIPTVVSGKDHTIKHIKEFSIIVPFELDEGNFFIDVCIED